MDALKRKLAGWTKLHNAATVGDIAEVRLQVQRQPSFLNRATKDTGQTALHLACTAGRDVVVGELLDRQAALLCVDTDGRTPLHTAAAAGQARCCAVLLGPRAKGLAPSDRLQLLHARDKDGRDALLLAVMMGHALVVEELLRCGADPRTSCDSSGASPLHVAAQNGNLALLKVLLPYMQPPPGATSTSGPAQYGVDVRQASTGSTPLHVAAAHGQTATAVWLVSCGGANASARDNSGQTPGEVALKAGHPQVHKAIRDAVPGAQSPAGPSGPYQQQHSLTAVPPGQQGNPANAGGAAEVWQPLQNPAAGQQRLQVPAAPPPTVYYPSLPPGASSYY